MNVLAVVGVLVSVVGVAMNSLSSRVFLRQDWRKNTVTATLLSLTLSDTCVLAWSLLYYGAHFLTDIARDQGVNLSALQSYVFAWPRSMFYDISSCTTVLVSLERCLCVALPLKVNSVLTPRRVQTILCLIWCLGLASYIPVFTSHFFVRRLEPATNMTLLTIGVTSYRPKVEAIHNILNTLFLQTVCQITLVISTCVMAYGLYRSSKFQEHSSSLPSVEKSKVSSPGEQKDEVLSTQDNEGDNKSNEQHPNDSAVPQTEPDRGVRSPRAKREKKVSKEGNKAVAPSTKYKRTIRVVSGVSSLFIVCNTPLLVVVYMKRLFPGFGFGLSHHSEYVLAVNIVFLSTAINAASNFFVYAVFNRKFRDELRRLCGRNAKYS
ncbi:uncharacterized protein LOC101863060 [Aplysia californica]|uniref:Uncharacterized protein LOC101863060 n=1 Tax=Aplysia californica TaxID=6500 RepID=A0ABM0K695_APLCA|nr:uncharacterized protein LOC101863060 [Aplysia californica]